MWANEMRFISDPAIQQGTAIVMGDTWLVHPYDYLAQVYKGKLPLYTRHTLGAREAERDRRLYA